MPYSLAWVSRQEGDVMDCDGQIIIGWVNPEGLCRLLQCKIMYTNVGQG